MLRWLRGAFRRVLLRGNIWETKWEIFRCFCCFLCFLRTTPERDWDWAERGILNLRSAAAGFGRGHIVQQFHLWAGFRLGGEFLIKIVHSSPQLRNFGGRVRALPLLKVSSQCLAGHD